MEEYLDNEEKIIGLFLRDKSIAKQWMQDKITIDYFDPVHHNILSGVIFACNNDVLLTRQSYKDFLDAYKNLSPQQLAGEVALFSRCYIQGAKTDDLPMMLEKVRSAYVRRKTAQYFSEYKKDQQQTDDIVANRRLADKLLSLEADTSIAQIEVIEIHKSKDRFMEQLQKRRNNPDDRLICGIKEIDETMNVGFKPGHLTLFCADVSAFKTTMMINIALNIFKYSKQEANILFIPLEMPADEILNKIVSRETKIASHLIEHAEKLTEEQIKTISDEMDKWINIQNKFCIMDMPEGTRASVLRREIEKRLHYFQPRVVFVDYVDNLLPDYIRSRSDEQMNDTLASLRTMGRAMGFSVVSAAQLSRDALKRLKESKDGRVTSTDVRGGQVMSANSDSVYAQWRDPANPAENLIFTCIKARHGQTLFDNKRDKTVLHVRPEIGLIESPGVQIQQAFSKSKAVTDISIPPAFVDNDNESPF